MLNIKDLSVTELQRMLAGLNSNGNPSTYDVSAMEALKTLIQTELDSRKAPSMVSRLNK